MSVKTSASRRAGRWWLLSVAIMAVVWKLSSSGDTPGPPLVHPLDWIAHFITYLSLGYCLGRATGRPGVALVVAAWFGALDEVHQAFVPGREAGVQDWFFDVAGGWLGARLAVRAALKGGAQTETQAKDVPSVAVLLEFPR